MSTERRGSPLVGCLGSAFAGVTVGGALLFAAPILLCCAPVVLHDMSLTPEERAERRRQAQIQREIDEVDRRQKQEQRQRERAEAEAKRMEWPNAAPVSQKAFCAELLRSREAYNKASNDMARTQVRRERGRALRAIGDRVDGWRGTITEVTTTGSGKGVFRMSLAEPCQDFTIGTTNNDFSDALGRPTLIDPNSTTFDTLATMKVGSRIENVHGVLIDDRSGIDGFQHIALTEYGGMTETAFLFRFY